MPLTSSLLKAPHGFFTKDEDKDFITKNLSAQKLVTLKQIHSNIVHFYDLSFQRKLESSLNNSIEGDALVTDQPGIALGIITADCGPILFHDESAKIIGAAHAGWKGARAGIIENTIKLMKEKGSKNIIASLGPCIHQRSYEVDAGFRDNFLAEDKENHVFFLTGKMAGKFMFSLPGYIEKKLKAAGINKIDILNEDTLSQPNKFCSFRRATLANQPTSGRQISAICLK